MSKPYFMTAYHVSAYDADILYKSVKNSDFSVTCSFETLESI